MESDEKPTDRERICPICHKIFTTRTNLKIHQNRKTPCRPPNKKSDPTEKKYQCNRCEMRFRTNQKLTKHLNRKNPCEIKNIQPEEIALRELFEQLKEDNETLKTEMEELKTKTHMSATQTNVLNASTSINTNHNNNISINVYGNENMSHITDAMYKSCFKQMQRAVEKLFNLKHFSSNMKENQNIYISNLRDAYMMIYNSGKWDKVNKTITFNRIYYDLKDNLSDALDNMRSKKTIDSQLDKQFAWFVEDDLDDEQEAKFKKISCELMACMAYNNRQYPMAMKKQMEKDAKKKIDASFY
jgi:uncharacterized C2H2 Zn-finger protein